jgi:two-component system sensor histidine kinase UhpB
MEGLHPNILDAAGIVEAVGSLLEVWGQQHPEIEWRASLDRDLVCNEEQVRVAVYRIVQECLSNVARHASAQRLRLILARRPWPHGENLAPGRPGRWRRDGRRYAARGFRPARDA